MGTSTKKIKTSFDVLYELNVNDKVEKKEGLTYLSWAYAWAEFKKVYPEASYEVMKFGENGKPYFFDPETGYMVYTSVTVDGVTHEMWLPVMDSNNLAMKAEPYEVKFKYKTAYVKAATMFDINKTIMRCLTKNLAMFGLGLYIYAGEDLPEADDAETVEPKAEQKKAPAKKAAEKAEPEEAPSEEVEVAKKRKELNALLKKTDTDSKKFAAWVSEQCGRKITRPSDLTEEELDNAIAALKKKEAKKVEKTKEDPKEDAPVDPLNAAIEESNSDE